MNKKTFNELFNYFETENTELSETEIIDIVYDYIHNSLIMQSE